MEKTKIYRIVMVDGIMKGTLMELTGFLPNWVKKGINRKHLKIVKIYFV